MNRFKSTVKGSEPLLLLESYHHEPSSESHYEIINILFSEVKIVMYYNEYI